MILKQTQKLHTEFISRLSETSLKIKMHIPSLPSNQITQKKQFIKTI